MVKRSRLRPLTAATRVRIPVESPLPSQYCEGIFFFTKKEWRPVHISDGIPFAMVLLGSLNGLNVKLRIVIVRSGHCRLGRRIQFSVLDPQNHLRRYPWSLLYSGSFLMSQVTFVASESAS